LTDEYGWPWIFYINVPIGLVGIFLASTVLVDPPHARRTVTRIDLVGIVLLTVSLTTLQIFLERGEREGWFESSFIVGTALITLLGYFDLARLTLESGVGRMLPGLLLTGAGMAFVFSSMSAAVMRAIPPALLAAASGIYTLSRRIGGNMGYALVANQIVHRTAFHRARLLDHLTLYDGRMTQAIDNLSGRLASSGLPPGVAE